MHQWFLRSSSARSARFAPPVQWGGTEGLHAAASSVTGGCPSFSAACSGGLFFPFFPDKYLPAASESCGASGTAVSCVTRGKEALQACFSAESSSAASVAEGEASSSVLSGRGSASTLLNALTVDVEDYFHVSAFEGVVSPSDWDSMPQRVVANTMRTLELFAEFDVKATFFTLGWVAERYPFLVKHIADAGHEIASHGYSHSRLNTLTSQAFRDELIRSRELLEDLSGTPVTGFRAPSWTIGSSTLWALDILIECGFTYDSSIFPIYHDIYGMPDADRFLHYIERETGRIIEFPPTTVELGAGKRSFNLPVAGGGYMRLLPGSLVRRALHHVNRKERQSAVIYFHPWEIDPNQPRLQAGWKSRFRHYLNLHRMEGRLRALLDEFAFAPMRDVVAQWSERQSRGTP